MPLPSFLYKSYKRYKRDTERFATWLAEFLIIPTYPSDRSPPHSPERFTHPVHQVFTKPVITGGPSSITNYQSQLENRIGGFGVTYQRILLSQTPRNSSMTRRIEKVSCIFKAQKSEKVI